MTILNWITWYWNFYCGRFNSTKLKLKFSSLRLIIVSHCDLTIFMRHDFLFLFLFIMTVTITDTHRKFYFSGLKECQRLKSVENFQHGTRKIFFLNLVCTSGSISLKVAMHATMVCVCFVADHIFFIGVEKLVQKWPKYTDSVTNIEK